MSSHQVKSWIKEDKENPLVQKKLNFNISNKLQGKKSEQSTRSVFTAKENINVQSRNSDLAKSHCKTSERTSQKAKKWKIFDETAHSSKKSKSASTQTEDGKELMCDEEPSEKYWEMLAEERRVALANALEENLQLANEMEAKNSLIESLKLEMEQLEEVASHTQYLSSVIEELMKDDELRTSKAPDSTHEPQTPETSAGKSLNTTDGNDQFNLYQSDLSEGSCSHDSDKENKPPTTCRP